MGRVTKPFRIISFKKIKPIIKFENVSLSYGNGLILDNVNFKINPSNLRNVGPNGVGKSTILI